VVRKMKKKVKMMCILKSGVKVEDSIKLDSKDTRIIRAIEKIREDVADYMASPTSDKGQFTFGKTTIALSEVAAISFKG
jgi:hypothetical protein